MTNVLILGTLGDLVKKITELEMLDRTPSRDNTIQMYAYNAILEEWPVTDREAVRSTIASFRVQCAKHIAIETSLEELSKASSGRIGSSEWIQHAGMMLAATSRYLDSKQKLRQSLVLLNSLGRGIGKPPITVGLHDGNVFSDDEVVEHREEVPNG